jgi:hypothetical protein
MVAAAADIIVLNGQGITNLPWLFHVADRTHMILRQVSVTCGSCVAGLRARRPNIAAVSPGTAVLDLQGYLWCISLTASSTSDVACCLCSTK